jgi:hypothetical protein
LSATEAEYSLAYGPLEAAVATLCHAPADAVRVRFRKLRLRDFPDRIQIGSGSRVRYDLPRALAMCAAFALSNGLVSQSEAVDLVEATWPEWCRALLAAAVDRDYLARPQGMAPDASPIVSVIPRGFAEPSATHFATTAVLTAPAEAPATCIVAVNAGAILDVLAATPAESGDLESALRELESSFGWSRADVPMRADIAEMPPQRGFLDDGPYFKRAAAMLDLCEARPDCNSADPEKRDAVHLWRMKILSDYLQAPAPLDAWKAAVGDEERGARLGQLLTICAREAGVHIRKHDPHSPFLIAGAEAIAAARGMIARGESRRGKKGHG